MRADISLSGPGPWTINRDPRDRSHQRRKRGRDEFMGYDSGAPAGSELGLQVPETVDTDWRPFHVF